MKNKLKPRAEKQPMMPQSWEESWVVPPQSESVNQKTDRGALTWNTAQRQVKYVKEIRSQEGQNENI